MVWVTMESIFVIFDWFPWRFTHSIISSVIYQIYTKMERAIEFREKERYSYSAMLLLGSFPVRKTRKQLRFSRQAYRKLLNSFSRFGKLLNTKYYYIIYCNKKGDAEGENGLE